MLDDAKVGPIYQQIAQIVIDMIPEKWEKVYLYSKMEEVGGCIFFHYYPVADEEPVYSLNIPKLFHVDEDEFEQLNDELWEQVEELWNEFKQSGHQPWSTLTMIMDQGKFNITFGYEDLSQGDSFERRLAWRYHHLGIVPKGDYAKKVLDEYLEKNQNNEEQ
jgi:uncharacterized protein (TIGR01741 family)